MGNSLLCEFRKVEQKTSEDKTIYYILKILLEDRSTDVFFKDNEELYNELKQIPRSTDIQLFYDLYLKRDGSWGIKPTAIQF